MGNATVRNLDPPRFRAESAMAPATSASAALQELYACTPVGCGAIPAVNFIGSSEVAAYGKTGRGFKPASRTMPTFHPHHVAKSKDRGSARIRFMVSFLADRQ